MSTPYFKTPVARNVWHLEVDIDTGYQFLLKKSRKGRWYAYHLSGHDFLPRGASSVAGIILLVLKKIRGTAW